MLGKAQTLLQYSKYITEKEINIEIMISANDPYLVYRCKICRILTNLLTFSR